MLVVRNHYALDVASLSLMIPTQIHRPARCSISDFIALEGKRGYIDTPLNAELQPFCLLVTPPCRANKIPPSLPSQVDRHSAVHGRLRSRSRLIGTGNENKISEAPFLEIFTLMTAVERPTGPLRQAMAESRQQAHEAPASQ